MTKVLSLLLTMLMFAANAMAETHSILSGKPTEGGSAFTADETYWAGVALLLFFCFLTWIFLKLCYVFLRDGQI